MTEQLKAQLLECWLERCDTLGYPKKGIKRANLFMDWLTGVRVGYALGIAGVGTPINTIRTPVDSWLMLASVRGETVLFPTEPKDKESR